MIRLGEVPSRIICSASWRAVALSRVPKGKERTEEERPESQTTTLPVGGSIPGSVEGESVSCELERTGFR